MAMTFTLVSQLREQLSELVRFKIAEENRREHEKERLLLEVRHWQHQNTRYDLTLKCKRRKKKSVLEVHR